MADGAAELAAGVQGEDLRSRDVGAVNLIYGSVTGLDRRRTALCTRATPKAAVRQPLIAGPAPGPASGCHAHDSQPGWTRRPG